jgi:predicted HTH domain antitoxin
MSTITFTPREEKELLQILERYLSDLEREMADTDRKEFRQELKKRGVIMKDLIKRLKAVVD